MKNQFKSVSSIVCAVLVCLGVFATPTGFAAEKPQGKAAQVQQIPSKVNVNKASATELASVLVGVGLKRAEAIVAYRKANGKFTRVEELASVKGIGEATVKKNRSRVRL